jgi:hypothetical protein
MAHQGDGNRTDTVWSGALADHNQQSGIPKASGSLKQLLVFFGTAFLMYVLLSPHTANYLGRNRAAFPLLRYVATGREHRNYHRHVPDGVSHSEHPESRCSSDPLEAG